MTKIERVVFDCLTYRGYGKAEAEKFIRVLKGDEDEKILSNGIVEQIDSILKERIDKISEYEKIIKENRELRSRNTDLIKEVNELQLLFDDISKENKVMRKQFKLAIGRIEDELRNTRSLLIKTGIL